MWQLQQKNIEDEPRSNKMCMEIIHRFSIRNQSRKLVYRKYLTTWERKMTFMRLQTTEKNIICMFSIWVISDSIIHTATYLSISLFSRPFIFPEAAVLWLSLHRITELSDQAITILSPVFSTCKISSLVQCKLSKDAPGRRTGAS